MIKQFPNKEKFPDSAPRYPNLWILVSEKLLKSYSFNRVKSANNKDALTFAVKALEQTLDISDDFGYLHTAEGCDSVARRRGLCPVIKGDRTHDHCIHVRFYLSPLNNQVYDIDGIRYIPACASVHFEVDRPGNLHPYQDDCEICGCVGKYEQYFDPNYKDKSSKIKNELHHDPIGVEAVIYGKVNGKAIPLLNGLETLEHSFDMEIKVFEKENLREDMNTGSLGVIIFKEIK